MYVKNGMEGWMSGWKKKGWKTAKSTPVANQDLWMKLDESMTNQQGKYECDGSRDIPWVWGNEGADELANMGAAMPEIE
ncbi:hypothetical protein BASA62_003204 [Batrachochytrium salamandrivorans]|nr:hypothetical protein BASA62_003204 [Batrachochytrium salamandrivorans]